MKKTWIAAVIGLVLILGVGFTGCDGTASGTLNLNGNLTSQQEGIWVSGQGKVTAVPDIAVLSLGVESQESSVAEARDNAAVAMEAVIAALKAQGIANEDIQTQYFSIRQITDWYNNKESIVGYRVTNTVTAKVRDVDTAGDVIDAAVVAGGDLIRINSFDFSVDEPRPYYEEARELAIQYAQDKAEQLAAEAGVSLDEVTYITESSTSNYYSSYSNYVMEDALAVPMITVEVPTEISVGELEISTTVQVAYSIK